MHFNEAYAEEIEFGKRLVDGTFFHLVVSKYEHHRRLGQRHREPRLRRHLPLRTRLPQRYPFTESEVLSCFESTSRDHDGIVETELQTYNQNGERVLPLKRTPMVLKHEFAQPSAAQSPGWPEEIGTQSDNGSKDD